MAEVTDDPQPGLINVVLHEASHNLGPSHDYAVSGKTDSQIFGGPLAAMLEELKAEVAGLWYVDLLAKKKLLTPTEVRQIYAAELIWQFGHISRGMYDAAGKPKAYSQVAAIELGSLMRSGAVRWDPAAPAENGSDRGAFTIDFAKMPLAIEALAKTVGQIKGRGDKAAAEQLVRDFVDSTYIPQPVIAERQLRAPKASFVYSVDL